MSSKNIPLTNHCFSSAESGICAWGLAIHRGPMLLKQNKTHILTKSLHGSLLSLHSTHLSTQRHHKTWRACMRSPSVADQRCSIRTSRDHHEGHRSVHAQVAAHGTSYSQSWHMQPQFVPLCHGPWQGNGKQQLACRKPFVAHTGPQSKQLRIS